MLVDSVLGGGEISGKVGFCCGLWEYEVLDNKMRWFKVSVQVDLRVRLDDL